MEKNMELEKTIESLKRYINSQEQKLDDYYRMDEEFYKDEIEQLELSLKLLRTVLNHLKQNEHELNSQRNYCKMIEEQKDDIIKTMAERITKQEKMIELMTLAISSYDGQLVINQYKDRNDVKAKFEEYVEDGTYEQYFEKKAEESE